MDMLKLRGYQIIGDAAVQFKPVDAIAQFKYRGYLISMSTAGLSIGACQTEVEVFDKNNNRVHPTGLNTVEEAIEYINSIIQ